MRSLRSIWACVAPRDVCDAIDHVGEIVGIRSVDGRMTYLNAQWHRFTGTPAGTGLGDDWRRFIHPDDLAGLDTSLQPASRMPLEVRLRRADGAFRWFAVRSAGLMQRPRSRGRSVVILRDIDELKTAQSPARDDPQTDIANRARLVDHLQKAIGLAERAGAGVVVLYLDLDHFGSINETYGHAAGDAVLAQIGARIAGVLRAGDTASRFGGDEFVLVCATSVGARHAVHIAERLALSLAKPVAIGGHFEQIRTSIGISLYPTDGADADALIRNAQIALGAAKQSGRSTYRIFGERMHEATVGAIEFEADLREAIDVKHFHVAYQPIVNISSGIVLGAEALVRWNHPRRGLLLPGDFIPFAERAGLIGAIGDIVIEAACAQLNAFILADDDPFAIAINVSAAQFFSGGFVETVAGALARHGLPPRRIKLEITESIMMGNGPEIIETVNRLSALGIRLSIDDFGTGYSSLAYLRDFPIDTLKIDRSFVNGITTDRTQEAISRAIVTLAHSMNMHVIGEGVETAEQVDVLRAIGTDSLQGNFISPPLPGPEFAAFVASHDAGVFPAIRRRRLASGPAADRMAGYWS